ncbi:alpha/beta fold hydrolase [Streptomyces coeruleoprunus]|uniref:Alpha/beta fold hydrolase n=1 Tax=Streptomyces coeruleoprunus TaxID=285563 RepID=A0ABV9XRX8_9ACTN
MTLFHETAGDGPAVVFLHSSVADSRMWEPQWRPLAEAGHRVVRCDFRGFGRTPLPVTEPDGVVRPAQDVLDLLDALGIERAALVGASFGGGVAVEIAARHPERVSALALLCAGLPGREPGPELRDFDAREDALYEAGDLDGLVELNVDTWLGPDAGEDVRQLVRTMQRHAFEVQFAAPDVEFADDGEVDLSAIEVPCLAVSGERDLQDFREIAAALPGRLRPGLARHVEIAGVGHLPNLERPDEVTALLRDFLRDALVGAGR